MAQLKDVQVDLVDPNPHQTRRDFDEERLRALAESIKTDGLIQPIIVVQQGKRYTLVAGERRLRAVKMTKQDTIQAKVVDFTKNIEETLRRGAVIENAQRQDLNILETIQAVKELKDEAGFSMDEIAQMFGRSRKWVEIRYSVATEAPSEFVNALNSGEIGLSWWHGLNVLINAYPQLSQDATKAVLDGRWSNKDDIKHFASVAKKGEWANSIVQAVIRYPLVFTDRAVETLEELPVGERQEIANNVMAAQDDPDMPDMTESLVIEYAESLIKRKERSKQMADLRKMIEQEEAKSKQALSDAEKAYAQRKSALQAKLQKLLAEQKQEIEELETDFGRQQVKAEQERNRAYKEAKKRIAESTPDSELTEEQKAELETLEKGHQKAAVEADQARRQLFEEKRNELEQKYAAMEADATSDLTSEQKAELENIEKEYTEQKSILEEEAERRQEEAEREWAERMSEAQKRIKELQAEWRKTAWKNPVRDTLQHLYREMMGAEVINKDLPNLDMDVVIADMPQQEFEDLGRMLTLIESRFDFWKRELDRIKEAHQRRAKQPIRALRSVK